MKNKNTLSFLTTLLFCLSLQSYLTKGYSLWDLNGLTILGSTKFSLALMLFCLILKFALKLTVSPLAFLGWMWFLFFSEWLDRPYNFFQGLGARGEIILFSILSFFLIKYRQYRFFNILPFLATVICCTSFIAISEGKLLFSDDHTVFFFRFEQLKENFPNIPFYYPLWNAGIDARDYFATGALNIFAIFSALIYTFPLEKIYNIIILLLLFVFHPLCVYLAAKLEKIPSPGPAIASALSLCLSLSWYRWALQYGTLGFITSCALIPFNLVCISYILDDEQEFKRKLAFIFIFTFSLMLFWSLSGFAFVPAILIALLKFKRIVFKKNVLITGIVLLSINLPWVFTFWTVSNVSKFVTEDRDNHNVHNPQAQEDPAVGKNRESTYEAFRTYTARALRVLRENTIPVNPVLLILGSLGLLLYSPRANRLFLLTSIWLLLLCCVISPLNPKLELDRMLVILSVVLTLPTAKSFLSFLKFAEEKDYQLAKQISVSLAGGFLITSVYVAGTIVSNRSLMHYYFQNDDVTQMAKSINENAGDGRVLYTGFVLHELSNGHLAPLTYMTKKPLMASSHVHNQWKYKQSIPAFYLRTDQGIENYFDLYNISALFAHEKYWIQYLSANPEKFEEVQGAGKFKMYKRRNFRSNYFLEGNGQFLSQSSNSITIRTDSPAVTLKFNYFPFLTSSSCKLVSKKYGDDLNLIALENCTPGETVTIKSVSLFKRLFNRS